jgi:NADP-dependent aldehyde dehydrogenase
MGQFCTNPGLLIAMETDGLNSFIETLSDEIEKVIPANMLHAGIHSAYYKKMNDALTQKGVALIKQSSAKTEHLQALPTVATVSGEIFLQNSLLHEEVFGPYSLLVVCKNVDELIAVWKSVRGQLTTSLMGTDKDFAAYTSLIQVAETIAGRIVFNNVPTGVEVCPSMMHGGPFPASTDSRFTAVGIDSVKRWVRPVCYQNCPQELLPVELQNDNPRKIWRLVNNEWTKDNVK